jgi:citrate synthase
MHEAWMSANEAARRLNISTQTLYAYVSRGLLQSEAIEGSRGKRYRRSDIEKLVTRQNTTRKPKAAVRASLAWGLPVLRSALTMIRDGRLYYRGKDAATLADTASLEALAANLWGCEFRELFETPLYEPRVETLRKLINFGEQPSPQRSLSAFMALLAQESHPPKEKRSVATQGMQLLRLMRSATTLLACPEHLSLEPVHLQLQNVWQLSPPQGELIRRALILCADHELNVSSFTTRCVASSGARLDACVVAGLAALTGVRHGGITSIIEKNWHRWLELPTLFKQSHQRVLEALESSPQGIAPLNIGFGHSLYPEGDPRARAILAGLPPDADLERLSTLVHAASGLHPSLDFALVALRRHLGLPEGSAFALFAIGRVVGWVAHALEQQQDGSLIRPRADYIGPLPEEPKKTGGTTPNSHRVIRFR